MGNQLQVLTIKNTLNQEKTFINKIQLSAFKGKVCINPDEAAIKEFGNLPENEQTDEKLQNLRFDFRALIIRQYVLLCMLANSSINPVHKTRYKKQLLITGIAVDGAPIPIVRLKKDVQTNDIKVLGNIILPMIFPNIVDTVESLAVWKAINDHE